MVTLGVQYYILFPFFLFLILSWLMTRMSFLIFISFFTMTITGAFYSMFCHCMGVFTVITEVSHFLFLFFSSLLYNSRQAGWKGLPLCSDIVEPCMILWHCSHIISYCTFTLILLNEHLKYYNENMRKSFNGVYNSHNI